MRALTLLEVVISISLIVVLLSVLLAFFGQTVRVRDQVALAADRTELARAVLDRIATELRGCVGSDEIGFPVEQRLVGDRRGITFLTTALPTRQQYEFFSEQEAPPPAQHDLTLVTYKLWVDPDERREDGEPMIGGIVRSEKRTLNQFVVNEDDPLQVRNDLWSHELGFLEFRYFDGVEWDIRWDLTEGNSLPQLVQITVGFLPCTSDELDDADLNDYPLAEYPLSDDQPRPDRYSVVVRIPAADRLFSSRIQRVGQQLSEQLGVQEGQ